MKSSLTLSIIDKSTIVLVVSEVGGLENVSVVRLLAIVACTVRHPTTTHCRNPLTTATCSGEYLYDYLSDSNWVVVPF
jgi:hypothetical protein